jgi:methionyl-tRNA formyltransferase
VEQLARRLALPIRSPTTLKGESDSLRALDLDVLVVAAYGLILPPAILKLPRLGCVNVHASLLPRWRGAAPVERAIMAGDTRTGISIMQMDAGLDTGPVLASVPCEILEDDTGDSLTARLSEIGAASILDSLARIGTLQRTPQPSTGATYAAKLSPAESRIDWTAPAHDVELKIRALCSRQPAFCIARGERVRLLFARVAAGTTIAAPGTVLDVSRAGMLVACRGDMVRITRLALSRGSGKPMDVQSLLNGHLGLIGTGDSLAGT